MFGTLQIKDNKWFVKQTLPDKTENLYPVQNNHSFTKEFENLNVVFTLTRGELEILSIDKSSLKSDWDDIFEKIEKDLKDEISYRTKNYLKNTYFPPEKKYNV